MKLSHVLSINIHSLNYYLGAMHLSPRCGCILHSTQYVSTQCVNTQQLVLDALVLNTLILNALVLNILVLNTLVLDTLVLNTLVLNTVVLNTLVLNALVPKALMLDGPEGAPQNVLDFDHPRICFLSVIMLHIGALSALTPRGSDRTAEN